MDSFIQLNYNIMKRIFIFFALFVSCFCAHAQPDFSAVSPSGQTLYYEIISSSTDVRLVGNLGSDGGWSTDVVRPFGALVVPSHVVHSGITYTVTGEYGAFWNLDSLLSVSLPSTMTSIENGCFSGCVRLSQIYVDEANLVYDSRDNCNAIIKSATNELIAGCKSTVIPNTVTRLGETAFWGTDSLTYIGIPPSIKRVDEYVFWKCNNISSVYYNARRATFSNGSDIYGGGYSGMFPHTLISLTIGEDVDSIVSNAFTNQNSLQQIILEKEIPPVITNTTFSGISTNIPIFVPCGTAAIYRNAPFWNVFSNYIEDGCEQPELCMVSVENSHNVIYWNDEYEVAAYNIYRESVVAGEYELIGTVSSDSILRWVDSASRPNTRSYRYKISASDNEGNESILSPEHKTMHLTINQGLGGRWNLQWTPYEGAEYTTYIIYRGSTADSLEQIDIMPADGNTSYTDETATDGDVFYQVGIVMANGCALMESKSASVSRSNIATNASTQGIYNIGDDGISIRSESGRIVVNGTTDEVRVLDMVGRIIRNEALPAGVYMVKIGDRPARKIVVMK